MTQYWPEELLQCCKEFDLYSKLAFEYHGRTEAFDRTVCREMRGYTAMPTTRAERVAVNFNARDVFEDIVRRENCNPLALRAAINGLVHEFERQLANNHGKLTLEIFG